MAATYTISGSYKNKFVQKYLYDAVGLTPAAMDFTNGKFSYGDWADKWFVTDNKPLMLKSNVANSTLLGLSL